MSMSFPTAGLRDLAKAMEEFEASASVARTGTGSRREGADFERLVSGLWAAFVDHLAPRCDTVETVLTNMRTGGVIRKWSRLPLAGRSLYLYVVTPKPLVRRSDEPARRSPTQVALF